MTKTCQRCGKCCYYLFEGVKKKCKHLVILPSGKTLCRIYNNRLGKVLDIKPNGNRIVCMLRTEIFHDFEGCPYNRGKPILW